MEKEAIKLGKEHKDTKRFDHSNLALNSKISKIKIYHDEKIIMGMKITYTDLTTGKCRKSDFPLEKDKKHQTKKITFDINEYIIEVVGRSGLALDAIGFITNQESKELVGGKGGVPFSHKAKKGFHIGFFKGGFGGFTPGCYIDYVEPHMFPIPLECPFKKFSNGKLHKDTVQFNHSSIAVNSKPSEITIYHDGTCVMGLKVHYINLATKKVKKSIEHLNNIDFQDEVQKVTFKFDFDEFITGIIGRSGDAIDALGFITTKGTRDLIGGSGGVKFHFEAPGQIHIFHILKEVLVDILLGNT